MSFPIFDPAHLFGILEGIDHGRLKSAVSLVLNQPIHRLNYYALRARGFNEEFPPQPSVEYIPIEYIDGILGGDGVQIFLAVDQVLSLLPRRLFNEVVNRVMGGEDLEIIRMIGRTLCSNYLKTVSGLKPKDLVCEDSRKEHILLAAPSEKQFKIVRGRWRRYAWREETVKGDKAPSVEGWIRDVTNLSDILNDEGIKTTIIADKSLDGRLPVSKKNIFYLDMSENLCKIGYVRDSSVTWFNRPIMCNMALEFRRGEEEMMNEVYWMLGITPVIRPRWIIEDRKLTQAKMEGGNFFIIKGYDEIGLITGLGVRGSDIQLFNLLDKIFPEEVRFLGIPLAGYLKDWMSGAVHLDVVLTYVGEVGEGRILLVDPSRMGFYSLIEYDRISKNLKVIPFMKFAKEFDVIIDELPRRKGSPITSLNALNLGGGKLVVDEYNKDANSYLEKELRVDLIQVEMPHIEAGGGGPRCATRDIPTSSC